VRYDRGGIVSAPAGSPGVQVWHPPVVEQPRGVGAALAAFSLSRPLRRTRRTARCAFTARGCDPPLGPVVPHAARSPPAVATRRSGPSYRTLRVHRPRSRPAARRRLDQPTGGPCQQRPWESQLPAGADLTGAASVVIWCKQFAVQFAAATLET